MSAKAFWMFKNQGDGELAKALSKKKLFFCQGFDSPVCARQWRKLKAGDFVFCYQTKGREIAGIAKVVKKGDQKHEMYVALKSLKSFKVPFKTHALKRKESRLASVDCLQAGPFRAISRVTINDARVLAKACCVSRFVRRSKRKSKPIEALATSSAFDTELAEWVTRLLDRHEGDRIKAKHEADLAAESFAFGSNSRHLMECVAKEIMQQKGDVSDGRSGGNSSASDSGDDLRPGSECTCGGVNKDCFRCGGSGIVQEQNCAASIRDIAPFGYVFGQEVPTRMTRRGLATSLTHCPTCGCPIKPQNIRKHLLRVHRQTFVPTPEYKVFEVAN